VTAADLPVIAERTERALIGLALTLSVVLAASFVLVVVNTIDYPYPLDWLEGGTVDVIRRINRGLPVYAEPSVEYVAFNYTPSYYFIAAGASRLLGDGLMAPRLVSLLATIGICLLIWSFVRRETGSKLAGITGIGLYLGAFEITDAWYQQARVDSLLLLLLLAAFYILRFRDSALAAVVAGLLFGVGFFAKQTALMVALPALAVLALADWRKAGLATAAMAATVLGGTAAYDAASDGWFSYYIFTVPRHSGHLWMSGVSFWTRDVGRMTLLAGIASIGFVVGLARTDRSRGGFYGGMLAGGICAGMLGRTHAGGVLNALIPTYAVFAILMPIAVERFIAAGGALVPSASTRKLIGLSALTIQLAVLLYDPWDTMPTSADRRAHEQLAEFLTASEKPVLVMSARGFDPANAARHQGLDLPVTDVIRVGDHSAEILLNSIATALKSGRFGGVIDPPEFVRAVVPLGRPEPIPAPARREHGKPAGKRNFPDTPTTYYPVPR
jgi:hypothetical protein